MVSARLARDGGGAFTFSLILVMDEMEPAFVDADEAEPAVYVDDDENVDDPDGVRYSAGCGAGFWGPIAVRISTQRTGQGGQGRT